MRLRAVFILALGLVFGILTLSGPIQAVGAQDGTPAAADDNEAIARQFYEIFNAGDLDALDAIIAADVIDHNPGPGQAPGLEGAKQSLAAFRAAFPDAEVVNEDVIVAGDKVVIRSTFRGTHGGELFGVPPTGLPVEIAAIDIFRIEGGQIVEVWHVEELLTMLIQIGAIPMPGAETAPMATPA